VNEPEKGYFEISADPDLVVAKDEMLLAQHLQKSLRLDTNYFDFHPEKSDDKIDDPIVKAEEA